MTLRLKEREMAAVSASVAAGCKPCTDYHVKASREAKLNDDEIRAAIDIAVDMRRSALEVMQAHGLANLGESVEVAHESAPQSTRIREFAAVAAAFAVNCITNLGRHLVAAETLGITEEEIS